MKLELEPMFGLPLVPVATSSLLASWSFTVDVHRVPKTLPASLGPSLFPKQVLKLEFASESPAQGLL